MSPKSNRRRTEGPSKIPVDTIETMLIKLRHLCYFILLLILVVLAKLWFVVEEWETMQFYEMQSCGPAPQNRTMSNPKQANVYTSASRPRFNTSVSASKTTQTPKSTAFLMTSSGRAQYDRSLFNSMPELPRGKTRVDVIKEYHDLERYETAPLNTRPLQDVKAKGKSTLPAVIAACLLYICASNAVIIAIKVLGRDYNFKLSFFLAAVQKSGWLYSGAFLLTMLCNGSHRVQRIGWQRAMEFCLIGLMSALSNYCITRGVIMLKGSVYSIVKSSDLFWTFILSLIFLRKKFTAFHVLAIVLVLIGVVLVAVERSEDNVSNLKGILWTLGGALTDSLGSVLPDFVMKKVGGKKSGKSGKSLGLTMEYSFFTSLVSFSVLVCIAFGVGEAQTWPDELYALSERYAFAVDSTKAAWFLILLWLLSISKQIVTLTKLFICYVRSAFTFSLLKPMRRVSTLIFFLGFFGDVVTVFKVVSGFLTVIGFCSYIFGSRLISKRARRLQQQLLMFDAAEQDRDRSANDVGDVEEALDEFASANTEKKVTERSPLIN